ncbi:hypothetical protein GQ457_10G005070 [Hibiscus cannabinus]
MAETAELSTNSSQIEFISVCDLVCMDLPVVDWKFETNIRKTNDYLIIILISEVVYFGVTTLTIDYYPTN